MKRMFINLLVYLLISSYQLKSQTLYSVDKWMEYIEEMASETEDEERIEALYTDLSYLIEHPFELNTVTEGQLKRLPFLSDLQIRELLEYRSRYGKMLTLYELKNVEAFDLETISLLVPFIYISEIIVDKRPITVKNLLKRGSNNLQIRYDRCIQQKKGYCSYPDSVLQQYPNRKYLGEPFYHSVRYSYEFDERIQFGLVAEKDVGEPFWNEYHKGYDYYSVHLFLKEIRRMTAGHTEITSQAEKGFRVPGDFTDVLLTGQCGGKPQLSDNFRSPLAYGSKGIDKCGGPHPHMLFYFFLGCQQVLGKHALILGLRLSRHFFHPQPGPVTLVQVIAVILHLYQAGFRHLLKFFPGGVRVIGILVRRVGVLVRVVADGRDDKFALILLCQFKSIEVIVIIPVVKSEKNRLFRQFLSLGIRNQVAHQDRGITVLFQVLQVVLKFSGGNHIFPVARLIL